MGKGSRNREGRLTVNDAGQNGGAKLSKKQQIKLQEKKARTKKAITIAAAVVIVIGIVVGVLSCALKTPNLAGTVGATSEYYEIDNGVVAYLMYTEYQNFVSTYSYYLSYFGLDTSIGFKNQMLSSYAQLLLGTQQTTWFGYFLESARNQLNEYVALASTAIEKGYTLSDEDMADIDEVMHNLEHSAEHAGTSLNKYLASVYCDGLKASSIRKCLELQQLAYNYYTDLMDSYEYSDEEITKYLEDHLDKFYKFDYTYYTFSAEYKTGATEDEKTKAFDLLKKEAKLFADTYGADIETFKQAIVDLELAKKAESSTTTTGTGTTGATTTAGTTTEATTTEATTTASVAKNGTSAAETTTPAATTEAITVGSSSGAATEAVSGTDGMTEEEKKAQEILATYVKEGVAYKYDDEFTTWAWKDERKAGDIKILEDSEAGTCTVIFLERTAYKDDYVTRDVRHILFTKDDYETLDAAKAKANEILEQFKALPAEEQTPEKFGELAKEYTADSNGDEGGLYENVLRDQMVTEFNDWIYHADRKVGDTEVVKTTYGYHVMYLEGFGIEAWKVNSENYLKSEQYEEEIKAMKEAYPVTYDYDSIADNIP